MARLKGELTTIDLLTQFSIRPGGRIFDLSKQLDFEIKWDGSNIVERFTNDVLTGSGHTSCSGPTPAHTGFFVNATGSFDTFRPNLAWTNDEFTIAFWAKFEDVNFVSSSNYETPRQYDFIAARNTEAVNTFPPINKRFSTFIKKNDAGTGVRIYFGMLNTTFLANPPPAPTLWAHVVFNFCDSYDNLGIVQNAARNHAETNYNLYGGDGITTAPESLDTPYHSERAARPIDINFGEWTHFVLRSKTRKNASLGICDLWINGKLRSKYITTFKGSGLEDYDVPPGAGVLGEKQLVNGGSIYVPGLADLPYSFYANNSDDKLYISNHNFFQFAKWNRVLGEDEINALYAGTITGVYTERVGSVSIPPRKKINLINQNSYSNDDSAYTDNNTYAGNSSGFYGSNKSLDYFDGEEIQDAIGQLPVEILQRDVIINKNHKIGPFIDEVNSNLLDCLDGTKASTVIKVNVSSVENNGNLQYAGRTDSASARTISNQIFSMLLSSSLYRRGNLSIEYQNLQGSQASGIAGTGFLYYSPSKKCWIEKRHQHETSLGTNNISKDTDNACNIIEVNPYTMDDGNGGWLAYNSSFSPPFNLDRMDVIVNDATAYVSSKLQVTGVSEIFGQFTSSPQLAYFLNDENSLKNAGYQNIGTPTVAFGAPFSPKYHAFDDETIKLNNFIEAPFELKKAILRIPVEIQRVNEKNEGYYINEYKPVLYLNFETTASNGDTVPDLTGNGHDGVLYGNATVDLTTTPGNIDGRGRLNLEYDATLSTKDYLLVNHDDELRITATENKTISFWLRVPTFDGVQREILFKGSNDGSLAEYRCFINASGELVFRVYDTSSSGILNDYLARTTANPIPFGSEWFHVAIVYQYDGSPVTKIQFYINGKLVDKNPSGTGTFSFPKIASHDIYVGSRGEVFAQDSKDNLASLIYFNRLLNDNEVSALYLSGLNSKRLGWNWTENVVSRKDMDNYVFFLYRQRRSNVNASFIDSNQDISSSVRFLIGSASLCVYNSSSFGLAHRDGFIDYFGVNTPITSSFSAGRTRAINLNEMFRSASFDRDPVTFENTIKTSEPLHGPSIKFNADLNDYETGSISYRKRTYIEIEIDPAYVLGGYPNNSLMYVTTSKGYLSTSFTFADSIDTQESGYNSTTCSRLFNFYPQRGTFENKNDQNATPQITTIFQNFWFGGTRQPAIAYSGSYETPNAIDVNVLKPYYQFDNNKIAEDSYSLSQSNPNFNVAPYGKLNLGSTSPLFDIELARTGLSVYSLTDSVFSRGFQLVTDGRGKLNTLESRANPVPASVFGRTSLINAPPENDEISISPNFGVFSIGSLKNASFADIVSSVTIGYAANSPAAGRNVYNPYILLPEDELVLGLDAGISSPPDIAPIMGKNLYDQIPIGQKRSKQTAMVDSILKNNIWHYAGNSYLRVLPGNAELLLIGDYIKDDSRSLNNKKINSSNISTVIGDNFISDQFETSEADAYAGTYISQNFDGSMALGTRGVVSDDAIRSQTSGGTIKPFKVVENKNILIIDKAKNLG
jgi:hypothetical protein